MKAKIYLILFMMFTLAHKAISQYVPMVAENKFWIYQQFWSNDKPNVSSGYLIHFEGDTIINNTTYKIVYHRDLSGTHPCPPGQRPCFVFDQPFRIIGKYIIGFIRDDITEKKVYFKSISGTYCGEDEYVLFDFSLKVGDELDSCKRSAIGFEQNFGRIDSISSIQSFGTLRKVFHTTGFTSYIGLPPIGQVNLVESIGFEKHGLFYEPNNLNELYDYCEGPFNECNIFLKNTDMINHKLFNVFPNPVKNTAYYDSNIHVKSATIFNLYGQIKYPKTEMGSIELDGMDSGVYIVKVITKEGETYMTKLVKE